MPRSTIGNEVVTEWRGFDDKILSMYGLGFSTQVIQENLKEIYNVNVPPELVSRVTDEVKGLVEEWRNRPLEPFYTVVSLTRCM